MGYETQTVQLLEATGNKQTEPTHRKESYVSILTRICSKLQWGTLKMATKSKRWVPAFSIFILFRNVAGPFSFSPSHSFNLINCISSLCTKTALIAEAVYVFKDSHLLTTCVCVCPASWVVVWVWSKKKCFFNFCCDCLLCSCTTVNICLSM